MHVFFIEFVERGPPVCHHWSPFPALWHLSLHHCTFLLEAISGAPALKTAFPIAHLEGPPLLPKVLPCKPLPLPSLLFISST